jgi:hypothetical protein
MFIGVLFEVTFCKSLSRLANTEVEITSELPNMADFNIGHITHMVRT